MGSGHSGNGKEALRKNLVTSRVRGQGDGRVKDGHISYLNKEVSQ